VSGEEGKAKLSFLKNGLDQVAIVVEDLDQAVENYWKLLGVGPWRIHTFGRPAVKRMSYRGQPAEFKFRVAFGQVGAMRIELIEVLEGQTIYGDWVKQRGYGLHHVGVLVDDMEKALEEAREAGLSVLQEGSGYGLDGDGHYAYLDTGKLIGTILELIKLPARRAAPDRVYPLEEAK
jgi:catechol 2,3-dioxygenase-like lactoylglutathione lyase family enzyme